MKSLSTNQMAILSGAQFNGNCTNLCQRAYFGTLSPNPVLYLMASAIWNGRGCSGCSYGEYNEWP